jgi:DNA-binding winged helix-turn-helix (wHTH) protein/Tol biopolymer transport system component
MSSPARLPKEVRFGRFELDLETAELRDGAKKLILAGQPFQLLKILLDRPGELVSREELIRRLWPDDTFVDFNQSLNKAVNRLREALQDSADSPCLIETLPRKGYRFVGEVKWQATPGSAASPSLELASSAEDPKPKILEKPASLATVESAAVERRFPLPAKIAISTTALVALLAVVWIAFEFLREKDPWQSAKRLTNSAGVRDLTLSPDGQFLVYAFHSGPEDSLRRRELATDKDIELLPAGPGFHGLTFSNDGRELYLIRSDPKDLGFKHLYVMPASGGEARKLVSDVDSPVSFSPNGDLLVYEHCLQPRNDIDLIIARPDGTWIRHLATLRDASGFLFQPGPAWSPDGKFIAVPALTATENPMWVLYLVSVEDGSIRKIMESAGDFGRPVWMNRQKLVLPHFDSKSNTRRLWTVSVADGQARPVTHGPEDYAPEVAATRDTRLLAAITIHRTANIWSAPANAPEDARQSTHSGIAIFSVVETFDGKLLILDAEGIPWTMVADGSQWTRFADLDHADWLTACGHYVVFLHNGRGTPELLRFDQDGTHMTKLAAGNIWGPACAADGNSIYYVSIRQPQAIWKVPTAGGQPRKVADVLGNQVDDRIAVSPDGRKLAYIYTQYGHIPSDGWHLAVLSLERGSVLATQPIPGDISNLHWTPAGKEFQYVRPGPGAANLWSQPVSGGRLQQLTRFTSGQIFDFNWSNDGARLLISRGEVATDAVLMTRPR